MNIILGHEAAEQAAQRYTVLELDSFHFASTDQVVPAYCVIENLSIDEMALLDKWKDLHSNLIKNYRNKNWSYCQQSIEHLTGKWQGELDSFYNELLGRVQQFAQKDPGEHWTWTIARE